MNALDVELTRLRKEATLQKSVDDVDRILDELMRAREAIATGLGQPSHVF
jgi:hypothetical protein